MKNPEFLKKKYPELHTSSEIKAATWWTGENLTQKPAQRIQAFLNFFNNIIEAKKPEEQERGINAIKQLFHQKFVIKPEELPESYFTTQQRLARELGHGDIEITKEMRDQHTEVIIIEQQSSLDKWIDYLSSPDAMYPDWLKYYAMRSVIKIGEYDKEKKAFTKRTKGTVKPFPDLNREALAYVLDAIEKKHKQADLDFGEMAEEEKQEFAELLQGENFAKLYAWAIEKVTPASQEALTSTKGKWVKYDQNSDHMPLVKSLQGHGTGWCTAGESTAQTQLQGGDFYVYYSYDEKGQPKIPRAAIRMQEGNIAEVRGIAKEQNLDPHIGDVVKKKLQEFPDGKEYEKKVEDMKKLTEIDNKARAGKELNQQDLIFLYEIKSPIQGFGYQADPRIKELRGKRNPEEDAPIVFGCKKEQIAHNKDEVNKDTKVYIGELYPGIFDQLKNVERIYTSFPEGRIMQKEITIGGKSAKELIKEIEEKGYKMSDWAKQMMDNKEFKLAKKEQKLDLVVLSVAGLGFPQSATRAEIYEQAQKLGFEIVPPEVGPQLRLQYEDQPLGESLLIGSEPLLAASSGYLSVFHVYRNNIGRWLDYYHGDPDHPWSSDSRWVVARK